MGRYHLANENRSFSAQAGCANTVLVALCLSITITGVGCRDELGAAPAGPGPILTLKMPEDPWGMSTSGHLLVTCVHKKNELWCWNWHNMQAPPKKTACLRPYDAATFADSRVVEDVHLGMWHDWSRDETYSGQERSRYLALAREEDQVMAGAKYLQEIATAKVHPLVVRNFAGDEFSIIHKKEQAWYVDGLVSSKNGSYIAVRLAEEITVTHRFDDAGIRLAVIDQDTTSLQWVSTTRADAKDNHRPHITEFAISDDGGRIAIIGYNGQGGWVYVADARQKRKLWEHRTIKGTVAFHGGDISPDGRTLYAGGTAGSLFRFDGATGRQLARRNLGGRIEDVVVSPQGGLVAAAVQGRGILLCDARRLDVLHTIRPPGSYTAVAFSPDGRRLAVRGIGTIWVYAVPDHQPTTRSRPRS